MFRYLCPAAISKTHSCPHFLMKPLISSFEISGIKISLKTLLQFMKEKGWPIISSILLMDQSVIPQNIGLFD